MDERDYLWLSGCLLLLSVATGMLGRRVRQLDDDVRYLMDNALTRQTTEAKP